MSGSTFDQCAEMQLDELLGVATEDAFVSCSRLYCEFRSQNPQIRGAVPVRASEVHEEPLDYCLSAEIIAKRVLSVREYVLWQRFSQHSPEAVEKLLPRSSKDTLRIDWAPLLTSFPQLFRKAQRAWNRAELKAKRRAVATGRGRAGSRDGSESPRSSLTPNNFTCVKTQPQPNTNSQIQE